MEFRALYSIIETCKLGAIDPEAYLRDILARIGDHKINRIEQLLPWNWAAAKDQAAAAQLATRQPPAPRGAADAYFLR